MISTMVSNLLELYIMLFICCIVLVKGDEWSVIRVTLLGDSLPAKAIHVHNLIDKLEKLTKSKIKGYKFSFNYRKFGKIAQLTERIENWLDHSNPRQDEDEEIIDKYSDREIKANVYILFWDCDVADVHEEILK